MSLKYRVRLQNERVVGPFNEQEILELFEKGHITGNEQCQHFPIGDWQPIGKFPELSLKIDELKHTRMDQEGNGEKVISPDEPIKSEAEIKKSRDDQIVPVSKNLPKENSTPNKDTKNKTQTNFQSFKEFKFKHGAKVDVDYKELERKHREENPFHDTDDSEIEKTLVISKKQLKENFDKTIVVPSRFKHDSASNNEGTKKTLHVEELELKVKAKKNEIQLSENIAQEKTQFVDLREILPSINAQLKASEIELEQKAKIEESEERHRLKIERDQKFKENLVKANQGPNEDEATSSRKKKGMSWIVAFAFLAIIYNLLYPDEKPMPTGPVFININFPITKEFEDRNKAKEELLAGRMSYGKNNYIDRVIAGTHFKNSVEFQFSNNPALGELILNQSELLENAKNEKHAASVIYKLVKISEKAILKDVNSATGAALFYGKIGRPNTGLNVIKNYLRLGAKPNVKMLGVYLELCILARDFVEARKVFDKLNNTSKKPFEIYLTLAKFLETDEKFAEAEVIIDEGLKFFPRNVALLLRKASYLLKAQSIEKFGEVLELINKLNSERSPVYAAEFFHYLGMFKALKNKNGDAALLFKRSLEMRENDELRAKLSALDIAGNKISQNLILESKVLSLIKRAKEEISNGNWDQATTLSTEAVDANPYYVPAALVLADLQFRRGLFEAAIHTLISVKEKNPSNFTIVTLLIQTYLKAYKLDEAQRLLVEVSQTKFSQNSDYYYLYGLFFEKKKNLILAIKYFQEALKRNPVSDVIMFKLAKIFYQNKKFIDSKKMLGEALILDPKNAEYRSLYAQIINEQDNADTAIGYLRDVMNELGEDPKLLSTITSIYFKSGQIKEFKSYYKRIQNLPKKDEAFYEFLVKASRLEESWEDYEIYSKEIIKINPGNLDIRMDLADFYLSKGRHQEAIDELMEIKGKLSSYPNVHYMLARVYLNQGELNKAREMAALELKLNPSLDTAYFIMGEVYRQNKSYREAVANYELAISKNGKYVEALMALGWIRLNQNVASEALDLYMRVSTIDPTNPEVHRQLGYTYKALGQRSMAKEKFEDYLKLSPGASDRSMIEQIIRTLR